MMNMDVVEPDLPAYLKAIGAVHRADEQTRGWCWQQAVQPNEQSVQLVVVDGQPVAASVQHFGTHPREERCTHIDLAVGDGDGCSAHHVRFDSGRSVYSAASMDYGPEAIAIRDVAWTEDQKLGEIVLLQANRVAGIH